MDTDKGEGTDCGCKEWAECKRAIGKMKRNCNNCDRINNKNKIIKK